MHFKTINYDVIALEWVFKTFFLHVVKVCEKEVFHFRKLKVLKNCLFAKTYAPNFLKNQLQQNLTAQKQQWYLVIFLFLHPCLNTLQKSSAQEVHFSPKDWDSRLQFKPMFDQVEGKNWETRILSTVCGNLFGSFTEFFRRESKPTLTQTQRIFEKSQTSYHSQKLPH